MKNISRLIVLLLGLTFQLPVFSADQITRSFIPGLQQGREVLSHVPVKGLITEFMNPKKDSGLGKSIGYLLWREALTAVQDQGGAGVIYAHTPDQTQITDMLRKDYHRAAVEIAKSQNTRMVLWGQVNEIKDAIYLNSYLTLLPELVGDELSLSVKLRGLGKNTFGAEISRSRYNFKLVKTDRTSLFNRFIVTRKKAKVYASANSSSIVIKNVAKNIALQSVDMKGSWFKVKVSSEKTGWIKLGDVDVPPAEIYASRRNINIRTAPAGRKVLFKGNLDGNYRVLDMRYISGKGLWYKLKLGNRSGWVAGWLVEPRFSLPAVHFMAGLQRYQLKNYSAAEKAFKQFIDITTENESHVNLSAANLLYGASQLMQNQRSSSGLSAIQNAVTLTPYDPAVYNLRAVASIGKQQDANIIVSDLKTALKLDSSNARSVKTLGTLSNIVKNPRFKNSRALKKLNIKPKTRQDIKLLNEKVLMINPGLLIKPPGSLQVIKPVKIQQ
ncbi:MAG: hypothetical protein GY744_18335 [Gammaproteobacteria bacterium]|nr:hypothetical protein [Gammaproteobacteria bacterium]